MVKVKVAVYRDKVVVGFRGLSLTKTDRLIYEGNVDEKELQNIVLKWKLVRGRT